MFFMLSASYDENTVLNLKQNLSAEYGDGINVNKII